jgi:hypothetical protein
MGLGKPMTTATARALLDWYRTNLCDDNPVSAWHTLNRSGPAALTACVTPQDFAIVADAMVVAAELVKELNIPPGREVDHFINRRMVLK